MVWLEERAKLADHLVERDLLHLVSLQELEVTGVAEAVLPEHASATLVRDAAFDGEPRLPTREIEPLKESHLDARAFELHATVVVVPRFSDATCCAHQGWHLSYPEGQLCQKPSHAGRDGGAWRSGARAHLLVVCPTASLPSLRLFSDEHPVKTIGKAKLGTDIFFSRFIPGVPRRSLGGLCHAAIPTYFCACVHASFKLGVFG